MAADISLPPPPRQCVECLVDRARGKARFKRGGDRQKVDLHDIPNRAENDPDLVLTLDEALSLLAAEDHPTAEVAKLRLVRRAVDRRSSLRPRDLSRYRLPELDLRPSVAAKRR